MIKIENFKKGYPDLDFPKFRPVFGQKLSRLRFNYSDSLTKYFFDIWYWGADDIDIFDSTFKWVTSITHYGEVRYYFPD